MSTAELLVGVDIGSTHVKAVLLRPGIGVVHVARRDTPGHGSPNGAAYYEPAQLLGLVEETIRECAEACAAEPDGGDVAAIGIASMAEAGVPVDRAGEPLGEILTWYDARPEPQAAHLERVFGAETIFRRTGLRADAKFSLPKLMWWRAERPEAFARFHRWAGVAELAALRLTGKLATNASLATRTLAFDPAARRWDRELLAAGGFDEGHMPEVVPFGRPAGHITAETARRLGVTAGIPVAIAGHDHVAAGIGSGVVSPGDALDSMGTAEATLLVTPGPVTTEAVRQRGFSTGAHAIDGQGYVIGGLQSAGSTIEWFIDAFLPPTPDRYGALDELLAAAPAPSDVLAKPYPRGRTAPFPDRAATLEIGGLRVGHGAGDVAAALVDGAAFHVRWMFDELRVATGTSPASIRVTGGGTRNPRWLAAKTALSVAPLALVRTDEAAALGAALVGGIAAGRYADLAAALSDAASAETLTATECERDEYRRAYAERWLPWVSAGWRRQA